MSQECSEPSLVSGHPVQHRNPHWAPLPLLLLPSGHLCSSVHPVTHHEADPGAALLFQPLAHCRRRRVRPVSLSALPISTITWEVPQKIDQIRNSDRKTQGSVFNKRLQDVSVAIGIGRNLPSKSERTFCWVIFMILRWWSYWDVGLIPRCKKPPFLEGTL